MYMCVCVCVCVCVYTGKKKTHRKVTRQVIGNGYGSGVVGSVQMDGLQRGQFSWF